MNCCSFSSFTALVTGCRHIGGRKADLIAPSHEEWDISRFARGNVTYVIDGKLVIDPSPEQFRSMKDGDRVNARPGVSKADQLGTKYGDKDVPLPYRPDDPLNAAARMVALELALPVRGERRASTPFFTMNAELECLSHTVADSLFAKLAVHALGEDIAGTLSLHSGRIWKAVALHALDVCVGQWRRQWGAGRGSAWPPWREVASMQTVHAKKQIDASKYHGYVSIGVAYTIDKVLCSQYLYSYCCLGPS